MKFPAHAVTVLVESRLDDLIGTTIHYPTAVCSCGWSHGGDHGYFLEKNDAQVWAWDWANWHREKNPT